MDDYTCHIYMDQNGNVLAKACGSGDTEISFDIGHVPVTPDYPWYQDVWNWITALWAAHQSVQIVGVILAVALVLGLIWWTFDRAQWTGYADDVWDVEDHIDQLNTEAAERAGTSDYYSQT